MMIIHEKNCKCEHHLSDHDFQVPNRCEYVNCSFYSYEESPAQDTKQGTYTVENDGFRYMCACGNQSYVRPLSLLIKQERLRTLEEVITILKKRKKSMVKDVDGWLKQDRFIARAEIDVLIKRIKSLLEQAK